MRYLILSDIHANITALDAALESAAGRWDRVICLGDVVGYGPDPNEAIDRVRSLEAITIRGNHDKAVVGLLNWRTLILLPKLPSFGRANSSDRIIARIWKRFQRGRFLLIAFP